MLKRRTFRLFKRFLDTGIENMVQITADNTKQGFSYLAAFFRKKDVIESARSMLERFCYLSTAVHGAPTVVVVGHSNAMSHAAKVFLSAFMMHLHVNELFFVIGAKELTVIRSARTVVTDFNEVVLAMKSTKSFFMVPAALCRRFNANLAQFLVDFKEFELNDRKPVWDRLKSALIPLYFSYFNRSMPNTTTTTKDSSERGLILEHIKEVRAKALKYHGQAALDSFDTELRQGAFGIPPISCTDQLETLFADPKFFILRSIERLLMAHELFLDVNYRTTTESLLQSPIYVYSSKDDNLHWNAVLCDLLSYPVIFTTLRHVLSELKGQILRIVEDPTRRRWVDESINLRILHNGGWSECVDVVHLTMNVIKRIQAPIRDRETNQRWQTFEVIETPEEMVEALKFIRFCLKTAECDTHSIKMLFISRALNDSGCVYTGRKFQDLLNRGEITLERTKVGGMNIIIILLGTMEVTPPSFHSQVWLISAIQMRLGTDACYLRPRLTHMGVKKILFSGLEQLLFSKKLLNNEQDFPETYLLDVWRLCSLQRKLRIDAAFVYSSACLKRMLAEYNLATTDTGKLVVERVDQLFMSMEYGVRVSDCE